MRACDLQQGLSRRLLWNSLALALCAGVSAAGCHGQLGDYCRSDDECGGGLRCSTRDGTRGVCTYPAGADDLGTDARGALDALAADSAIDSGLHDGTAVDGVTPDARRTDGSAADAARDARTPDSASPDAPAPPPDLALDAPPVTPDAP